MKYLIPGLKAARVNLLQNDFCAGLPSPTAFLGLAACIAHKLGLDRWKLSVLPVLHSVDRSIGRLRPAMEAKNGGYVTVELQEDMTGEVSFSLILDLPEQVSEIRLAEALTGLRLAGGVIFRDKTKKIELLADDAKNLVRCARGFALVPWRPDGETTCSFGTRDSLRRVAATLWPDDPKLRKGWRVPVAVGYRLLGTPSLAPSGSRDASVPHVFAEPGVGIAELVSVRSARLTNLPPSEFDGLFWSWTSSRTHIVAHSAYLPAEKDSRHE
ncbi:hypothetical protein LAZ40_05565 [Cereibacter sphaeroides]|uniref:type I-F CRISPR-associated protein Csy2 n=1 Tax=Cereibacter sphaeroides TaxID=1063 RepID=UPI001F2592D3|nr:type I-F CRISPR-associated protein Csy2 [Cereibacter sphaeroides]MCE6958517.1 hypothetical protein [Cereibacter sphaeroides]MCE6972821.1 hypothetical protein [Cereibacter sphaeroides]